MEKAVGPAGMDVLGRINKYELILLFFATIGLIAFVQALVLKNIITGTTRTWLEQQMGSSWAFAIVPVFVMAYISGKAFKGKFMFDEQTVLKLFVVIALVWLLYMFVPQFMPPSFNMISP